jgi:hypothetical protein
MVKGITFKNMLKMKIYTDFDEACVNSIENNQVCVQKYLSSIILLYGKYFLFWTIEEGSSFMIQ